MLWESFACVTPFGQSGDLQSGDPPTCRILRAEKRIIKLPREKGDCRFASFVRTNAYRLAIGRAIIHTIHRLRNLRRYSVPVEKTH